MFGNEQEQWDAILAERDKYKAALHKIIEEGTTVTACENIARQALGMQPIGMFKDSPIVQSNEQDSFLMKLLTGIPLAQASDIVIYVNSILEEQKKSYEAKLAQKVEYEYDVRYCSGILLKERLNEWAGEGWQIISSSSNGTVCEVIIKRPKQLQNEVSS